MKRYTSILGVVSVLTLWTAAAQETPKVETYLGYEYVRFNSATNVPSFSANGGGGQFIYNFNSWIGLVADIGAVHNSNRNGLNLDSTFASAMLGPRLSVRKWHRFTPYVEVLWGSMYATSSTQITGNVFGPGFLPNDSPVSARLKASGTAFAMTAGGGLELKISKHVAFRPIALDYYLTRFQSVGSGVRNDQNSLRYSTGFTFMFGGEKAAPHVAAAPPPPSTRTCPDGTTVGMNEPCPALNVTVNIHATPQELCAGEKAQVGATIGGAPSNAMNLVWTANGAQVGSGPSLIFDSTGKEPGNYQVAVAVHGQGIHTATASTTITVREYRPPTGTVQANPAQIQSGEKSALTSSFDGQCGGPIQAAQYEASEGSVQGTQFDSSSVPFDTSTTAEQRKTVTITAKAADNRNTGTATTTIEVIKQASPAPIRLPDVLFSDNNSRVNNCGKRILLEQLRSYTERDSTGTVALVGHNSSDEKPADLAQARALNAAAIITAGTGVCLSIPGSQVQVSAPGVEQYGVSFESSFCQSSVRGGATEAGEMRRVEVWFVPTGGNLPASVTNNQSASSLPVSGLGCPK